VISATVQQNRLSPDKEVQNTAQILRNVNYEVKDIIQNALPDKNVDLSQIEVTIDENGNINIDSDDAEISTLIQQYSPQI